MIERKRLTKGVTLQTGSRSGLTNAGMNLTRDAGGGGGVGGFFWISLVSHMGITGRSHDGAPLMSSTGLYRCDRAALGILTFGGSEEPSSFLANQLQS